MMEKGLFKPPQKNFTHENEEVSDLNDGIGTVEDVTNEYHQERQKTEVMLKWCTFILILKACVCFKDLKV